MILDDIIEKTKIDLERRKQDIPFEWLGRSLAYNPFAPRDCSEILRSNEQDPYKLICEVKKASPSKGVIRQDFDPITIAKEYERAGASVLSVLTEPHFFQGSLEYLTQIRRFTPTPLLRKDFIIDEYQLLEAVVYGADMVLLIVRALPLKRLKELLEYSQRLGLSVLVEVHDKTELTKAIAAGADIIGINHRNLDTFEMDMELSKKLVPLIPSGKIIVAESGLDKKQTIEELSKIGVDAFLIGEHFMRQDDIYQAVKAIKN
jgi:indole-3-glycerol phosphate synthase